MSDTPLQADMITTASGLSVPASAGPPQPTRQQRRAAERDMEGRRKKYRELDSSGWPIPRQGDMRVQPCSQEAHPFHVASFCGSHVRWEPMPDDHPFAAALIKEAIAEKERRAAEQEASGEEE